MLRFKKRCSLFTLIKENSKDAKKLYKLVSQWTDQKEDNPLQENDDDTKLAEQFRDFFLKKIINIRKLFHNIQPYETQKDTIPRLDKLSTISEANLKITINQMPNISCQRDILNTSTLKKGIDVCIPAITRVIHLSLDKGEFYTYWKTAAMKPFIKSRQKGTIKLNYWPISNLSFTSKVVKNALYNNSTNTVMTTTSYQKTSPHTESAIAVRLVF